MDRPTRGPRKPNDPGMTGAARGAPPPNAVPDDPWANALQALQTLASPPQTSRDSAPIPPADPIAPSPRPPAPAMDPVRPSPRPRATPVAMPVATPVTMPQPRIDEALEALQMLASRHRADAPAMDHVDDPFPRRGVSTPPPRTAAFDPQANEPLSGPDWRDDSMAPARRWSRWGSPVLIIVSAAVLAVLIVGALSLSRQLFHRGDEPPATTAADQSAPAATGAAAPIMVRMPGADGRADLPTIEKAMAACDDEAARQPDSLYFLILPVLSPIRNYQPWVAASVGEIGTSVILLRSKDALDGLRDGSLTLYRGAYTFSIIDATTEAPQNWTPATGVAQFAKLDAAQIAGFRVRFGFADFVGDTPSNFRFPRQKGVCYWVSALLRE
jgi:hypothetical protein